MEKIKIKLRDSSLVLTVSLFDQEIDVDKILKTDINNIVGELVFFPVVINKLGVLLAQAEELESEAKLNLDIWQAKYEEQVRKKAADNSEKTTIKEVESKVITHPRYQQLKKEIAEATKTVGYVRSIYWGAKEKQDNLKNLSHTLNKGDVEDAVVQGSLEKMYGVVSAKSKGRLIE